MKPFFVVPSTTSHKHEPLIPALEIFARLGMHDLDLNLNHLVEGGVSVDDVREALAANGQRAWIASGGWCDFFHAEPQIHDTFASVERQVAMTLAFGADRLRLFFGRLPREQYSPRAREIIVANIQRLADRHPNMLFVFENHDGASSLPEVCRAVLEGVARANVRLTFDPMNFEHAGVNCSEARRALQPLIGHVHLKGYETSVDTASSARAMSI